MTKRIGAATQFAGRPSAVAEFFKHFALRAGPHQCKLADNEVKNISPAISLKNGDFLRWTIVLKSIPIGDKTG